jgi:hypothetical protein
MQPIVHSIGNKFATPCAQPLQEQGKSSEVFYGIADWNFFGHGAPCFACA